MSPVLGWLAAWGAAVLAVACLQTAGVGLGLGIGIADGVGVEDGFFAGLWLAVVQAGAFVAGGYAAARIARRNGIRHATLAWTLAMAATGADAILSAIRGAPQVIADLGLPYWNETGLGGNGEAAIALGILALSALVGAIVGGGLGQTANLAAHRRAEHDLEPLTGNTRAGADLEPGNVRQEPRMASPGDADSPREPHPTVARATIRR
jgi:hypothetical protein